MGQMRRAKRALILRDPTASLAEIVATDREAFSGLRLLFASDVAGVALEQLFDSPPTHIPVVGLFCGKRLLAFSDQIEAQMGAGVAPLRFGIRTVLDTNFLSDLPRLCGSEDFRHRKRLEETLEFVEAKLGRTLEWTFASLELIREVTRANNPWPYRKAAAAKFLDASPRQFRTQIGQSSMLDEYIPAAEEQWRAWIGSPYIWHTLDRRDLVYAVMLRAMLECWNGSTMAQGLERLVTYCLDSFQRLPLKEVYFGWTALRGFVGDGPRLPIFNEPELKKPGKNSLDRISALAWDLFLFR